MIPVLSKVIEGEIKMDETMNVFKENKFKKSCLF